jgi:hypothetical protein
MPDGINIDKTTIRFWTCILSLSMPRAIAISVRSKFLKAHANLGQVSYRANVHNNASSSAPCLDCLPDFEIEMWHSGLCAVGQVNCENCALRLVVCVASFSDGDL